MNPTASPDIIGQMRRVLRPVCVALFGLLVVGWAAGGGSPAHGQDVTRPGGGGGTAGGAGGSGGAFFGPPPGGAYNPEPAAVFSGHNLHVGAVVSADRKYVHLNMAPQQTVVTGVTNFVFLSQGGFVGSPGAGGSATNRPPPDPAGLRGSSSSPPPAAATSAPLTGVLAQPGMTRLAGP